MGDQRWTIYVCPKHGIFDGGSCECDPAPIEVVPASEVEEAIKQRDYDYKRFREAKDAVTAADSARVKAEAEVERLRELRLTDREVNCCRWAASIVAGVEKNWGDPHLSMGIREGEATSDVLAGIASRYERAALADRSEADLGGDDGHLAGAERVTSGNAAESAGSPAAPSPEKDSWADRGAADRSEDG